MTTGCHDHDRGSIAPDGGTPRDSQDETAPPPDDGDTLSFAMLFDRAGADVSIDDVRNTLRARRSGENE
jgi:hypothetical protein